MDNWQDMARAKADPDLWTELGRRLDREIEAALRQPGLIEDYYLPLFFHLHALAGEATLVAGINAPQGGGKSTLTAWLVRLFDWIGLRAVTVSIDDFYLRHADQRRLARDNPGNDYLQQRGYPGTHDLRLGADTLARLAGGETGELSLPRYDKSRHRGRGDRAGEETWPRVRLPVDVVLVEGWMLGFTPLPPERVADAQLAQINGLLAGYRDWHRFLGAFIYLHPEDPGYVVDWRVEAEERMKAAGRPGMTAQEAREYVEKFLPAYRLYGPRLLERPPVDGNFLKIEIGRDRLPTGREL